MSRLRRLSQNLIKAAPSPKKRMSIKRKRMMYGRDLNKLIQVMMPSVGSKDGGVRFNALQRHRSRFLTQLHRKLRHRAPFSLIQKGG